MSNTIEISEVKIPEIVADNSIRITDRKFYQWDGSCAEAYLDVGEGECLYAMIERGLRACNPEREYTDFSLFATMRYCRVWVDGAEIPSAQWKSTYPKKGAYIHIYESVKGGGGGGGAKSIIPLIAMIALSVVAPWAGGIAAAALGFSATGFVAGVIGAGILVGGSLLINALFPQAQPSLGNLDSSANEISQTYSLTGGRNSANPDGTVPCILGKHKFTPPLGSRSWTSWEGDTQYFHMLVVWGQEGVVVRDIKIGDTLLDSFDNVEHNFIPATDGKDLKIFNNTYLQQDIAATVDEVGTWVERSIGEAQGFILDIVFSQMFITKTQITSDGKSTTSIKCYFEMQYALDGTEDWVTFFNSSFKGEHQSAKVFTVSKANLPLGEYKIRIKRSQASTTGTSYPGEYYDSATWSIVRPYLRTPAFDTRVKWCCSELKIQAYEQMSGYVDDLNAIVSLSCEDYDISTNTYVTRETSNPASLARYTLLSPHMLILPFGKGKIDEVSFQSAHEYFRLNGYTFDFVCDSQVSLWQRLTQILSVARAGISFVDGKWSIIVDSAGKIPTQLFTPHNTWGINVQKAFPKLPHALRVTFVSAEDDYVQVPQMVYSDGYNKDGTGGKKKAIDIIEWSFPGAVYWPQVYKAARRFLASTLHRSYSVTTNVDWEYLASRRGDLVAWSHTVLMNTFGDGYITTLIYEKDGQNIYRIYGEEIPKDDTGNALTPVGMRLNDTVQFTHLAPARYGASIRRVTTEVEIGKYELIPAYGEEVLDLFFMYPLTVGNTPEIGDLVSIGFAGDEYEEYLLSDLSPKDDFSAELTFIPYAIEAIEAAETGDIPPYEPIVIQNTLTPHKGILAPELVRIESNEGVMLSSYGSFIIRMAVTCSPAVNQGMNGLVYQCEAINMTPDIETGEVIEYAISALGLSGSTITYFDNVREGDIYSVRARIVNPQTGVSSPWSEYQQHTIVGRTLPPPNVLSFTATIDSPNGVMLEWSAVEVADLESYVITNAANAEVKGTSLLVTNLLKKTGELTYSIQAKDAIGLLSKTPKTASVTVLAPKTPLLVSAVKTDGLWLTWNDCKSTWHIRHYEVTDAFTGKTHILYDEQLDVAPRPFGTYTFTVRALDIFDNYGEIASLDVIIAPVQLPTPTLSVVGGVLRLSWNSAISAFPVDTYEIYDKNGVLQHSTKSTYYDIPPDAENAAGVLTLQVRVKDTVGNYSSYQLFSEQLEAPEAPVVNVGVHQDKRQVVVSWESVTSQVPIEGFEVFAQYAIEGVLQEKDFGFFNTNTVFLEAVSALVDNATYTFFVRARNYMGMLGEIGQNSIQIQKLSSPQYLTKTVTDNNVFLSWQAPASGSFAVKEYRVLRQEGSEAQRTELYEEIGRIDSLFFGRFESKAGEYSYRIIPIDWAGVEGAPATILAFVDQPPDYTVYYDVDSTFNGTKINFELDGKGGMIGAVDVGETWQQNVDRIGQGNDLTWQQKHDLGYEHYLSPAMLNATYVEVVDINTFIATGRIQVTCLYETLEGIANVSCRIETSDDNIVWTLASEGTWETYATGFQYVRYTITVNSALVRLTELSYKVDIKLRKDNGTVYYDSSLGMNGVWVDFKTNFIDVQGAPIVSVPSSTFENPLQAYTIFEDVPNPTGFYVFVLDKNGTPTSADVTWLANGV